MINLIALNSINLFDYKYLFIEHEFLHNETFITNLISFKDSINNKGDINIKLLLPNEIEGKVDDVILIEKPSENAIIDFFERTVDIDGNVIPIYSFDIVMNDDTHLWEIYFSTNNELAIFSCSHSVNPLFQDIFHPYSQMKLTEKYKFITSTYISSQSAENFIKFLEENFRFSINN